jgi:predicted RNA binding protein YcfA (HicA-like mRNA interferase family)
MIMQKKEARTTITVPVPDHAELNMGTLAGIIRQSGLPRTLFEVD